MATKKTIPSDEKLDSQDLDLFQVLDALDKKDYGYYDRLTVDQQKKFVPFMMTKWMSAIKGNEGIQRYYTMAINEYANKYLFNEYVQKHPKLQWLMLCASSPGLGKQFHQWIPQIKEKVTQLKEPAVQKDIKEYYKKIYPKVSDTDIGEISKAFVIEQKRKMHIASIYPDMKLEDIETLSNIITDDQLIQYEKDRGNG